MNEVFLIGKVAEDVEYKFMLEKKKSAKATIKLKLLNGDELEIVAYEDIADYCLQSLKVEDVIILNGRITTSNIEAINIERMEVKK